MKILVLSNEVWNDKINGNNVASNWFEGMDAEFANIYLSPGSPYNNCCRKYFQVTDFMMLKSILKGIRAGKKIDYDDSDYSQTAEAEPKKLYSFLKSITGSFLRLIREILWCVGRYDRKAMADFINDFKPDVIFSERRATLKMLRLENVVTSLTNAPLYAFTGDDEYSLKHLRFSPFFWIDRFATRSALRKNVKKYKIYYTLSAEQKEDYEKRFGINCKILQKCGDINDYEKKETVSNPIRLIYAGKFYCNRWKVLAEISKLLAEINKGKVKIILEIYTKDKPTKKQNALLNDGVNSFIRGAVTQEQLKEIYRNSDIALHLESRDIKNRLLTRVSFSTKIIDCIFSGCAVMAYCWDKHSGYTYLKREDAAFCISTKKELKRTLNEIARNPEIIKEYAEKAYKCGLKNHQKQDVQKMLLNDFNFF